MVDIAEGIDVEGVPHAQLVKIFERAAADIQDEVTRIIFEFRKDSAITAYFVIDAKLTPEFDKDTDAERASAVGHSYAAAWIGAVMLLGLSAKRAVSSNDARLRKIVATEIHDAFNQGMLRAMEELPIDEYSKRWVTFDPCDHCVEHDGETVALNQDFFNSEVPPLHPNCRCLVELIHNAVD